MAVFYTQPNVVSKAIPQPKVAPWGQPPPYQPVPSPQPAVQKPPYPPAPGKFPPPYGWPGSLAGVPRTPQSRVPSLSQGVTPQGVPPGNVAGLSTILRTQSPYGRSGHAAGVPVTSQAQSPWERFVQERLRSPVHGSIGQTLPRVIGQGAGQPFQAGLVRSLVPMGNHEALTASMQQPTTLPRLGGQIPGPPLQTQGLLAGMSQQPVGMLQSALLGGGQGSPADLDRKLPAMFAPDEQQQALTHEIYKQLPTSISNLTTDIEKQKNDVLALMDIEKSKALNDTLARLGAGGNLSQAAADAISLATEAQYAAKKGALAAELDQQKIQNELAATQALGQLAESQGNLYLKSWAEQYQAWLEQRAADLNEERTRFEMNETKIGDMLAALYDLAMIKSEYGGERLWDMIDYLRSAWEAGGLQPWSASFSGML